jgi:hypothetical protein
MKEFFLYRLSSGFKQSNGLSHCFFNITNPFVWPWVKRLLNWPTALAHAKPSNVKPSKGLNGFNKDFNTKASRKTSWLSSFVATAQQAIS